jgi:CRP/FNR family transcriptional regulator, cyclic AMP receptor protein
MTPQFVRSREALKTLSFLGGLPDAMLDQLASRAHVKRYVKGETIFARDDAGESLMIVLAGRAKISNITNDAREIVLNFLGKGDVIGEIAILDGAPRTANVIAIEETETLILYRRDLLPALQKNPDAMLELIKVLCEKLRATSLIVEENTLPMAARAAAGLLRLADQHGRMVKGGTLIDLKLSQRDLGSYLGLSRENVSRQLGLFREVGLLRIDGPEILILDAEALRRYAEEPPVEERGG